jgi:hypothetical protein
MFQLAMVAGAPILQCESVCRNHALQFALKAKSFTTATGTVPLAQLLAHWPSMLKRRPA